MIGIVNYGMGNLGSIHNMIKKLGYDSKIIDNPDEIEGIDKLILPGVGHFGMAMDKLTSKGWIKPLNEFAILQKKPIMGICLGMQLMTKHSEEGDVDGLGWVDAEVFRFNFLNKDLKIPHMGWNEVHVDASSQLFEDFDFFEEPRFYHVHSYFVKLKDQKMEIAKTFYGFDFTSAFQKDNIYGVQFHPEKSHKFGLKLFSNFIKL